MVETAAGVLAAAVAAAAAAAPSVPLVLAAEVAAAPPGVPPKEAELRLRLAELRLVGGTPALESLDNSSSVSPWRANGSGSTFLRMNLEGIKRLKINQVRYSVGSCALL